MKNIRKISLCLLVLVISFICLSLQVNVFASDAKYSNYGATYQIKEVVDEYDFGYGITYQREISTSSVTQSGLTTGISLNVDSPQQANVITIKPSDDVQLVPYTFLEGGNWQATTVKKAALQYEATHPGYRVVAAVNGDFFRINDSVKASTGVTVGQGEYYKSVSNHGGINTLAIRNNGEGKQLFTANIKTSIPVLSIYDENGVVIKKINIDKVNKEPGENEISVYYAQRKEAFGNILNPEKASGVWFVKGALYAVTSLKDSFYGVGNINEFVNGEIELTKNQFAIKCNNKEINDMLNVDVKIRVQYEYDDPSVQGVENFIGFPYQLVSDGTYIGNNHPDDNNVKYRHPRTIVGQKDNGEVVLAVVDGRQNSKDMYGLSAVEMATFMSAHGCVDVWNLDGGGSSTLIIRKQPNWTFNNENNGFNTDKSDWYVTNSPSDGGERSDGNHLLVVVKLPDVTVDIESADEKNITLKVALLSDLEKYSSLYILNGSKYYEVQDGKVTITGLKKNTSYDFFLFAKVDGEYVNLMTSRNYSSSKSLPKTIELNVSLAERGDVKTILFRYKLDTTESIVKIVFIGNNGERYVTSSQALNLEKVEEIYSMIKDGKIEITCKPNNDLPEVVITVDNYVLKFDVEFLIDEMLNSSNDTLKDIFN